MTNMSARPANYKKVILTDPTPLATYYPGYLTPPQIATAYGIPASDGEGVKIGIISVGGGGFLQSDLNQIFSDLRFYGVLPVGTTAPVIKKVLLDGEAGIYGSDPAADGETTLDIYCVATMVPKADITVYIGNTWESPFEAAIADGCHILTVSWATLENDFLETIFNTAAQNKITICAASGDWGSTIPFYPLRLQPCYPSDSPNVISIGGTKLILNSDGTRQTETDDNRDPIFGATWGGGGGISTFFTVPSWQSELTYTPIVGNVIGNPTALTTRGTPDISAPMNAYVYYEDGILVGAGGTSAASPVMAGMLARAQALTGKQRSSAEYNALFYNHKSSFFDIVVGTTNVLINDGYAGTTSWDAVTGLGPPKGAEVFQYMNNGLRPSSGDVFPNHSFAKRPASGQLWPRTRTL